jgi:hypothetical protein
MSEFCKIEIIEPLTSTQVSGDKWKLLAKDLKQLKAASITLNSSKRLIT